jgi:predicted GIY-YIG superfamily endonuclease
LKTFVIYALAEPKTGVVRYVGRTQNLPERYAQHCRGTHCTAAWVRTLEARPVLVVLQTISAPAYVDADVLSRACETKWIKRFRRTIFNRYKRESFPVVWDALVNPGE